MSFRAALAAINYLHCAPLWHNVVFSLYPLIEEYINNIGYRSKNKKSPALSEKDEMLIRSCMMLGLSTDDTLAVYQILQSEEEVLYFSMYTLRNMFNKPDPADVILAACEIKEELENQKHSNLKHLI